MVIPASRETVGRLLIRPREFCIRISELYLKGKCSGEPTISYASLDSDRAKERNIDSSALNYTN